MGTSASGGNKYIGLKLWKTPAILGRKLEYIFGKATGRLHNLQRSAAMLKLLNSIGIFDNAEGRALLTSHLNEVFNTVGNVAETSGRTVTRESLLVGPTGVLKMQTVWEANILRTIYLFSGD